MTEMTTLSILRGALALIVEPEGWTQGVWRERPARGPCELER